MTDAQRRDNNPALADVALLEGDWRMDISNASFLPDPSESVRGHSSFHWALDGACLVMHQGDPPPSPPAALWLIGRDEASPEYEVLYFDARRVSRVYRMSFDAGMWKMWREAPGFWQRFECKVAPDGASMVGEWTKSLDDGATWEHDFDIIYTRE